METSPATSADRRVEIQHTYSNPSESTHVRVRVTARDLRNFRETFEATAWKRERANPLCAAINRTLRAGYSATFDGLSVGVIRKDAVINPAPGTPDAHLLREENRYGDLTYHARVMNEQGTDPFFRGASEAAQKLHRNALAHRKIKPARFTVSLPTRCLARTEAAIGV